MRRPVLSHIDMRVRDRKAAIAFYDEVLSALGLSRRDSEMWTSYYFAGEPMHEAADFIWFAFTEDANARPNLNRIAFVALSKEEVELAAQKAREAGSPDVEGPNYDEGPEYYATFFSDPEGNPLEVCYRTG